MKARGAIVLALIAFILLLAFGSYLLDIPMNVVLIGAAFAIGVILWVASRVAAPTRIEAPSEVEMKDDKDSAAQ